MDAEGIAEICQQISDCTPSLTKYYTPSAEERKIQQEKFYDTGENPSFEYPKIDPEKLKDYIAQLGILTYDLNQELSYLDEKSEPRWVTRALLEKAVEVSWQCDQALATSQENWRAFMHAGISIVGGEPKINEIGPHLAKLRGYKLPGGVLENVRPVFAYLTASEKEVFDSLLDQLEKAHDQATMRLDMIEFDRISKVLNEMLATYRHLIPEVSGVTIYDSQAIAQAFRLGLSALGLYNDWKVVIDTDRIKLAVAKVSKIIHVPASRTMTATELKKKVAHELFHVSRAAGAQMLEETRQFPLLTTGLPYYRAGEEGLAQVLESAIDGSNPLRAGGESFLANALAYGCEDRPLDFSEVYQQMYPVIKLGLLEENPDMEMSEIDQKAADNTWMRCEKTFRGGPFEPIETEPGSLFGTPNLTDLIYSRGARSVTKVLAQKPALANYLWLGKFHPAKRDHRSLLHELGVLPGSLV